MAEPSEFLVGKKAPFARIAHAQTVSVGSQCGEYRLAGGRVE